MSFDVENICAKVPIGEYFRISNRLGKNTPSSTRTQLELEGVIELLEPSPRNFYVQLKAMFYPQDEGIMMGLSLYPVVANISSIMQHDPKLWHPYSNDTFIIWDKGGK